MWLFFCFNFYIPLPETWNGGNGYPFSNTENKKDGGGFIVLSHVAIYFTIIVQSGLQ